jgi:pimeloyl-ACP methyl ester carboxylesterase
VVVIQTALTADYQLRPLPQLLSGSGHQVIHYHRRGYAGSGPLPRPASGIDEVADCRELQVALQVSPAHVVGASYSAAVALTLTSLVPHLVRTLTVIEPPPLGVPSESEFRGVSSRLREIFDTSGPQEPCPSCARCFGADWRRESERDLPGSVAAMERDAVTFLASDLPALLDWEFETRDAARVRCPVLYVGGSASGPWFAQVRSRILRLLPLPEDGVLPGVGHLLALTHPAAVAGIVVDLLRRHHGADPGQDRRAGRSGGTHCSSVLNV